jgi:hypothetical protein
MSWETGSGLSLLLRAIGCPRSGLLKGDVIGHVLFIRRTLGLKTF